MKRMITSIALGVAALLTVPGMETTADAQQYRGDYRYSNRNYDGRYYARRPVYSDNTQHAVSDLPFGRVYSSKTIDPRTGQEFSTTYWRDQRTGQVHTSKRVVDARTGQDTASTRVYDPYAGTTQRSRVSQDWRSGRADVSVSGRDPYSGVPYRSRSTHDPHYGYSATHEDPYSGRSYVSDTPWGRSWSYGW